MANNLIQIKRTSVTGRAANTTTLPNPGELALNMTDGILYSGNGSVVFEIGANNTNVNVSGNLTVKAIIANNSLGLAGQLLLSNGSNAYWGEPTSAGYAGSRGDTGFTGSRGDLGYTGSQGPQGTPGSEGAPGITGYVGSQGVDGYTGSSGFIGSIGFTGSTGVAEATYSNTAPASPFNGQFWFDPDVGILSYYYDAEDVWLSIGTGIQGAIGYAGSIGFTGSLGAVDPDTAYTFNNTILFTSNTTFQNTSTFQRVFEVLDTKTNANNVVSHNTFSSSIFYHSNVSSNFTANFTSLPTTDNRVISLALIIDQGGTGYYANAVQIDGSAQTLRWIDNNPTLTPSTNKIDIQHFTIIRVGSSWKVLSALTTYA